MNEGITMKVELSELWVHPDNERIYEPTDLNDLIESITDNDLLEPIVITKELGTLQIGPLQTGIRQIGLLQIGPLQLGFLQFGFLQITLRTLTPPSLTPAAGTQTGTTAERP